MFRPSNATHKLIIATNTTQKMHSRLNKNNPQEDGVSSVKSVCKPRRNAVKRLRGLKIDLSTKMLPLYSYQTVVIVSFIFSVNRTRIRTYTEIQR